MLTNSLEFDQFVVGGDGDDFMASAGAFLSLACGISSFEVKSRKAFIRGH